MTRNCILLGAMLLVLLPIKAQQTTQFSQFPWMTYAINPAYGGMEGVISATGWYRNQWAGLEGNLVARQVFAHSPFYIWNGGLGIQLSQIEAGVHAHNQVKLSYNYVKVWPSNLITSVGLAAGFRQRALDGRKIRTPGGIYEGGQIWHDDPTLPITLENGYAPDADFGMFFAYDRWEGGVSVQQVLGNRIDLQAEYPGGFVFRRTLNLHSEYEFLNYDEWILGANIWFRTDGSSFQNDILLKASYGKKLSGGFLFRGYDRFSIDAMAFMAHLRISKSFVLGYSYDITLSSLALASRGSHEIMLRYTLDYPLGQFRKGKIIYSPRL